MRHVKPLKSIGVLGCQMTIADVLADDGSVFPSTSALSVVRLARDLVNSATRIFSSSAATL